MTPQSILSKIGIVAMIAAIAFGLGWHFKGNEVEVSQMKDMQKLHDQLNAEYARGDILAGRLAKQTPDIQTVYVDVVKYIPKVTLVYKETPGAQLLPIPPTIYTAGYVRLWNTALQADLPSSAFDPTQAAGESDLVKANVTSADLLSNHADNAYQYAVCRASLNALIDWEEGRKQP